MFARTIRRNYYMKKIVVIIAMLFTVQSIFPQQEKAVQEFLKEIYKKVADTRDNDDNNYETLVQRFCSRKFREYYDETRRWESRTNECLLHWGGGGYDLFNGCQDYFDSVRFSIGNVHKIADEESYCATVTANFFCKEYDNKEWNAVRIVYVIEEKGEWRISNFQSPGEDSDLESMRKALLTSLGNWAKGDTAFITSHLEMIYKEIADIANNGQWCTDALDRYLSPQFMKLKHEICYWESKLGEMIIGADCWIRLQDWDRLEYKIDGIKFTSPSKAVADVIVTDTRQMSGEEKAFTSKTRLDLVFENGEWLIDDFADYNGNGGLYKSDSRLYREGIMEALEFFEGYIDYTIENEQ